MALKLTAPFTPEQKDILRDRHDQSHDWEPDQAEPWSLPLHGSVIFTVWWSNQFWFSQEQRDLLKHVHQQAVSTHQCKLDSPSTPWWLVTTALLRLS